MCTPAAHAAPTPATRPTGFVYDPVYLDHKTSASHPERPERLEAIVRQLTEDQFLPHLLAIKPRDARIEELTAIHAARYIQRFKEACARGDATFDSGDTPICKESYSAAVRAAGAPLAAIDAVMDGKVTNAFCAIRPPGHHALRDKAMGFCIFNNVAIAARYIQQRHRLGSVLIIDWDVHHGNGTQAAFDDDPIIFYFSVHRSPFYPGTGAASDSGTGKGTGTKLNVPMPAGATDADYIAAFREKLLPAAKQFKPDFVLISAGFDAHADDPLGGMKLTSAGYAELTRIAKSIADENCRGRLVSILEGGYDLRGLATSVEAHIRVLMEGAVLAGDAPAGKDPPRPEPLVIFSSNRSGAWSIWTIKPDGSQMKQLSKPGADEQDVDPAFSPDGSRILFTSTRGGKAGLWSMKRDGTDVSRICEGDQGGWAPDSKKIVLRRAGKLITHELDGGKEETVSPEGWDTCSGPSWSPDGKRIAFARLMANANAVYIIPPDGGEPKKVYDKQGACQPRWSPDGKLIVYETETHLCTINPDGTKNRLITYYGGVQRFARFGPDGKRIVFCQAASPEGPWELYTVSATGGTASKLTEGGSDMYPDWK